MFNNTTKMLIFFFVIFFGVAYGGGHKHHNSNICSLRIESLNFGIYNPLEIAVKRVPSQVSVRCTVDRAVSFSIKLVGGNSNNPIKRYLYSPSTRGKLYYNLYYNNCIWGDGSSGTCVISGIAHSNHHRGITELYFTIIGVIPAGQDVPAANDYYDIIQVFLEY